MYRSAFQLHLRRRHGQFLSNRGFCAPVPSVEGRGSGDALSRATLQVESYSLPPRLVQPLLSLTVTAPSQAAAAPRPLLPPEDTAALLRPTARPLLSPVETAVRQRPAICPLLPSEETAMLLHPVVHPLMSLAPLVPLQPAPILAGPRPLPSPVVEVPPPSAPVQLAMTLPALPWSGIPANIGVRPPPHA